MAAFKYRGIRFGKTPVFREYLIPVNPHSGYAVVKGKEIRAMDTTLRSKVYAASGFQNYTACIWVSNVSYRSCRQCIELVSFAS